MNEELTDQQREELHSRLLELEQELENALNAGKESAKPVELDQPIGRLTRMDAIQQQQMAKANRSAAELRLKQVRAALRLFQEDEYGDCRNCGDPIGFKRLSARPEAPFCLECQSAREQR